MKKFLFLAILLPTLSFSQQKMPLPINALSSISQTQIQPKTIVHPLSIGDTIPAVMLEHVLNYASPVVNTADLKGKLILLDFFATWCGSCLKGMPHLDSLQKQFNNGMQAFFVAYEPTAVIEKFIGTNKKARSVKLPFITSDTMLQAMFPHRLLPHNVWINGAGKIIAITKPGYITAGHIQTAIHDQAITLPVKNDNMLFNRARSLEEMQGSDAAILYRSVITKYFDGVASMSGQQYSADSTTKRIYYINHPVTGLYLAALGFEYQDRILLRVKNNTKYINTGAGDAWYNDNAYGYELSVASNTSPQKINAIMLQDVNRYFNTEAHIEQQLVNCLALQAIPGQGTSYKTSGGKPVIQWPSAVNESTILQNQPLRKLIVAINKNITAIPFNMVILNETGYTGNVDITLHSPLSDITALTKELTRYGLQLLPVRRELPMLIITETQ